MRQVVSLLVGVVHFVVVRATITKRLAPYVGTSIIKILM